jgi:hypothetical protein
MSDVDVGVDFELAVRLGTKPLADAIDRLSAREIERAKTPWDVTIPNVATCPSPTAAFAIDLSGPPHGYIWYLKRITVGGLTWATAAAGTAELYVLSEADATISLVRSLTNLVDQAPALPAVVNYTQHAITLTPRRHLRVVIAGGTAGQQYAAAAHYVIEPHVGAAEVATV